MIIDTSSSFIRRHLIGLFLVGIVMLFFAGQQLLTIWTPKSSLLLLRGTVQDCEIDVTTVHNKSRYGYESKSQKAELIFYLYEHKKKFAMVENIGDDWRHEQYEEIKRKLNRSDSVAVWIKKSELKYWEPKVFQIDADGQTILDFQTVRFRDRPITAFLLLLGLGSVFFPIWAFYPKLFSNNKGD